MLNCYLDIKLLSNEIFLMQQFQSEYLSRCWLCEKFTFSVCCCSVKGYSSVIYCTTSIGQTTACFDLLCDLKSKVLSWWKNKQHLKILHFHYITSNKYIVCKVWQSITNSIFSQKEHKIILGIGYNVMD